MNDRKEKPNLLEFFCKNTLNIVGCEWMDSRYCMKSCAYYSTHGKSKPEPDSGNCMKSCAHYSINGKSKPDK
jgi:hypothetical protein